MGVTKKKTVYPPAYVVLHGLSFHWAGGEINLNQGGWAAVKIKGLKRWRGKTQNKILKSRVQDWCKQLKKENIEQTSTDLLGNRY